MTKEIAITVLPVNDAPAITSTNFEIKEDELLNGQIIASDIEEQQLTFSVVAGSGANGQASIQSNGMFTFTPNLNFNGQASFDVQVSDSEQGKTQGTIVITIEAVDDIPVAESINMTISHNGSGSGTLKTADVDGESLAYSIITDVTNGTLTLSSSGDYTYSSNSGYSGSDSFTYEVTDGNNIAQGTITFNVESAPVVVTPPSVQEKSSGGSVNYIFIALLIGGFCFRKRQFILF